MNSVSVRRLSTSFAYLRAASSACPRAASHPVLASSPLPIPICIGHSACPAAASPHPQMPPHLTAILLARRSLSSSSYSSSAASHFVLISGVQFPLINNETEYADADPGGGSSFCMLTSKQALSVLRLNDVPRGGATSTVTINDPGEYAVMFSNRQDRVEVTMDVRTEIYNMRGPGRTRDYFPVELQPLPVIYAGVSAVYVAFLACGRGHARGGADPRHDGRSAAVQCVQNGVRSRGRVVRGAHWHATRMGRRVLRVWILVASCSSPSSSSASDGLSSNRISRA